MKSHRAKITSACCYHGVEHDIPFGPEDVYKSEFYRKTESVGCVYRWKKINFKEVIQEIMGPSKSKICRVGW